MSSPLAQYEQRHTSGECQFHDARLGLTISWAGFSDLAGLSRSAIVSKYAPAIERIMGVIDRIESGEHVNHTENRPVDHYNLRMEQERVANKSLQHSLDLWNRVKTDVAAMLQDKDRQIEDVVFNGIGGSFLGPYLLLQSQLGFDYNVGSKLRMHWCANTDPDSFTQLIEKLNLKRTVLVTISKSGSTAETKGNMDAFNAQLILAGVETVGPHNMAITVAGSQLDSYAAEKEFCHVYHMNEATGGRTSIVSAVGMVPCAFAGIDFEQFLRGMCHMDELTRRRDIFENPALLTAIAIHASEQRLGHKRNMIVLGYSDALRELAHYLQQLYMESIGKEHDIDGVWKPEGLTVFGGIGTGEQHAFMQQVQKGIGDNFVRLLNFRHRKTDYANDKAGTIGRQLLAFLLGTQTALVQNRRDFLSYTFDRCNPYNMGAIIAMEERIVTILAAIARLNAYDQPGVQDGKLACDAVNVLSKTVEARLAELGQSDDGKSRLHQWSGTASQFAKTFLPVVGQRAEINLVDLDMILSDLSGNPWTYSSLSSNFKCSRTYDTDSGSFVYTFYIGA